jgi:hypothetical protein
MSKSCVFLPNISFGVERDLTGIVRLQEGKEVLYASNMFQTYRIPVKEFGKGEHSLTLTFPSAWYEAKRIEAAEMEKNLPENKDRRTEEALVLERKLVQAIRAKGAIRLGMGLGSSGHDGGTLE